MCVLHSGQGVHEVHCNRVYPCAHPQHPVINPTDYGGCMKQGDVFHDPRYKWYEPQWALLGKEYFTHVWGSSYVVSGTAAQVLTSLPHGMLRFFNNEGVLQVYVCTSAHGASACDGYGGNKCQPPS